MDYDAYLSVPPPTEQCAMRYPCVQTLFTEPRQVCVDHVQLSLRAYLIGNDTLEIAAVIMAHLVATAGASSVEPLHATREQDKNIPRLVEVLQPLLLLLGRPLLLLLLVLSPLYPLRLNSLHRILCGL